MEQQQVLFEDEFHRQDPSTDEKRHSNISGVKQASVLQNVGQADRSSCVPENDVTTQKKGAHIELGRIGEEIAANWLRSQGYYIMDRNWKPKYIGCELDIVANKDNELHVVEVKTRSFKSAAYRDPATAIDEKRMHEMCKGASQYLKYHHYNFNYRIHAITIVYRAEDDYDLKFYPDIQDQLRIYDFQRYRYTR